MSTELQVYRELGREPTTALAFVKDVGAALRGGLKGASTPGASTAAALTMLTEGLTPPQFEAKYHVMDGGGMALKSTWMLAELERLGYSPEWIDDGEDGQKATLQITKGGKPYRVSFTIAMAKEKGIVKPKSTWAVDPALMLRARAIGRCVDMHVPAIRAGASDDDYDTDAESPEMAQRQKAAASKAKVKSDPAPSASPQPTPTVANDDDDAIDASFEVAPDPDAGELISDAEVEEIRKLAREVPRTYQTVKTVISKIFGSEKHITELSATQGKHVLIYQYMDAVNMPGEAISAGLQKMGVGEVEQLDKAKADAMLASLRKRYGAN